MNSKQEFSTDISEAAYLTENEKSLPSGSINVGLGLINMFCAVLYFFWWLDFSHIGNPVLYSMLIIGEVYHVLMTILFWWTVWPRKEKKPATDKYLTPKVDIYIPTAGEPVDIVRETIRSALAQNYPRNKFKVFVLNDGYVSKKDNWELIEITGISMGAECITRRESGGAKAGNINNALRTTEGEIIVIFDADMISEPDFLKKVIPFFKDKKIGFVQTPQFYHNFGENRLAETAWKQQEFFFGPVMVHKNRLNSAFICGTNVAIRRRALESVGGMREDNIAEDFLTSLNIHQKGWKSHYLNEVLAKGLAPHDLGSYYKQQFRWTRGSLEVLFWENPLFKGGLTLSQKLQYLMSALFYFNGVIVLFDITVPVIFLLTGQEPVFASTTSFAIYFIPFMFLNLFTLYKVSRGNLTFEAISLNQSLFVLQIQAILATVFRIRSSFVITPKKAQNSTYYLLSFPLFFYLAAAAFATFIGVNREGFSPSVVANLSWIIFNVIMFIPFIQFASNRGVLPEKSTIGKVQKLTTPPNYGKA